LFFRKVVDVTTNKSAIDKMCHGRTNIFINPIFEDVKQTPEDEACMREKNIKLKKSNTIRFASLLCAGIFAIILSYVLKQPALVLGLGLAGVFTILDATYGYWNDMDDKVKMSMVGLALVILMSSPALFKKYIGTIRQNM